MYRLSLLTWQELTDAQVWISGHVPPSPGNYFPGCVSRAYIYLNWEISATDNDNEVRSICGLGLEVPRHNSGAPLRREWMFPSLLSIIELTPSTAYER